MTSRRAKGRAFERLVGGHLRANGWTVDDMPRGKIGYRAGRVFSTPVDLWGCIDIAAMHPTLGLWFIQCTAGGDVSAKRAEVAMMPWPALAGLRVSVCEAMQQRNPMNRLRVDKLARVHDFNFTDRTWGVLEVLNVTPPRAEVADGVPA